MEINIKEELKEETKKEYTYRDAVKVISEDIKIGLTYKISDKTTFAIEAVKCIFDTEGNVVDKPIWGCIQTYPELKFFPLVGE